MSVFCCRKNEALYKQKMRAKEGEMKKMAESFEETFDVASQVTNV